MSSDMQWITGAITKARQQSPEAPNAIWKQVEDLLGGKFSERQLPAGELANVAKNLIAAMIPSPPKAEGS